MNSHSSDSTIKDTQLFQLDIEKLFQGTTISRNHIFLCQKAIYLLYLSLFLIFSISFFVLTLLTELSDQPLKIIRSSLKSYLFFATTVIAVTCANGRIRFGP